MKRMNFIWILLCVCQSLANNLTVMAILETTLGDSLDPSTSSSTLTVSSVVTDSTLDLNENEPMKDLEPGGPTSNSEEPMVAVSSRFVESVGSSEENLPGKDAKHEENSAWKETRIDPSVDTAFLESTDSSLEVTGSSILTDRSTDENSAQQGSNKQSGSLSQEKSEFEGLPTNADIKSPGVLKVEDHHPRSRHLGIPSHSFPGSPPIPILRHTTSGTGIAHTGESEVKKGPSPPPPLDDQVKKPLTPNVHEAKLHIGTIDVLAEASPSSGKVDSAAQTESSSDGITDDSQSTQFLRPPDGNSVSEEEAAGAQDDTFTKVGEGQSESPDGDNMPSFSEWTQKRLAEQEQKGGNIPASTSLQGKTPQVPKMRQKNYASADCGAKILGTNPEAQSSYAVLNSYDDEYMLNPCTAKMWLAIELCEPIQAKKIEVANFELFSSSPRQFIVYSSDRYPTRDWVLVGTFEAKEEKTVQSFALDQKAFHKFIKIELTSHYGSEHYCPLSLVRLYGTSELEVLDTDDDDNDGDGTQGQGGVHDQDGDSLQGGAQPPNLFGSAKDAVMSIVKKAAEALSRDKNAPQAPYTNNGTITNATVLVEGDAGFVSRPTTRGNYTIDKCITLLQKLHDDVNLIINHENLTGVHIGEVEEELSCNYHFLSELLKIEIVDRILKNCSLCHIHVIQLVNFSNNGDSKCQFLQSLIGPVRFSALCYLHWLTNLGPAFKMSNIQISTDINLESIAEESQATRLTYVNATTLPPSFDTALNIAEVLVDGTKTEICDTVVTTLSSPEVTPPLPDTSTTVTSSDVAKGDIVDSSQSLQELIQPTKTLKPDDVIGGQDDGSDRDASIAKPSDSSSIVVESSDKLETDDAMPKNVSREDFKIDFLQTLSEDSVVLSEGVRDDSAGAAESREKSVGTSAVEVESSGIVEPVSSAIDESSSVGSEHDEVSLSPSATQAPSSSTTATVSVGVTDVPGNKTSGVPVGNPSGGSVVGGSGNTQKESVFVRLSNRIKALELNMSLSSQYLEELSQRYRKQMEEMQRAFNKTIGALNETAKKAQEQDLKQQEMIASLQAQINNLSVAVNALQMERENLSTLILEPHVFVIFIELIIAVCMYGLLRRHSARYFRSLGIMAATSNALALDGATNLEDLKEENDRAVRRRNSFAGHPSPTSKLQRRPSEGALNIAVCSWKLESVRSRNARRFDDRRTSHSNNDGTIATTTNSTEDCRTEASQAPAQEKPRSPSRGIRNVEPAADFLGLGCSADSELQRRCQPSAAAATPAPERKCGFVK